MLWKFFFYIGNQSSCAKGSLTFLFPCAVYSPAVCHWDPQDTFVFMLLIHSVCKNIITLNELSLIFALKRVIYAFKWIMRKRKPIYNLLYLLEISAGSRLFLALRGSMYHPSGVISFRSEELPFSTFYSSRLLEKNFSFIFYLICFLL